MRLLQKITQEQAQGLQILFQQMPPMAIPPSVGLKGFTAVGDGGADEQVSAGLVQKMHSVSN
jgi:hypothetical protein